jgi:hypothetical protein
MKEFSAAVINKNFIFLLNSPGFDTLLQFLIAALI